MRINEIGVCSNRRRVRRRQRWHVTKQVSRGSAETCAIAPSAIAN